MPPSVINAEKKVFSDDSADVSTRGAMMPYPSVMRRFSGEKTGRFIG